MTPEEILAPLDADQAAVATAVSGPVAVLAGAGTGKTRALTHRVAYAVATGEMDPRRTLVVTFTTRAAGEFRRRLRSMQVPDVRVRTIHAEALRQLRFMWPLAVGGQMPQVQSSKYKLVAASLRRLGLNVDEAGRKDVLAGIERAKSSGLAPEQVGAQGVLGDRFRDAYQAYEELKSASGVLDFEDILLLNSGLLRDNASVAEQVRQWCRWVTVDEYQDVSPLQQQVIEGWLGDRDELCVVGDPSQTIYSFAGATSDHLTQFTHRWPNAQVLQLTRSYRCSPQIIELANEVLAGADAGARLRLASQRPPQSDVRTTVYQTEAEEAVAVASRIKELIATRSPEQIAILVRINAATARFERELHAQGIPYTVRGTNRFMQRPEVKRAVSLIRVAARQPGPGDVAEAVAAVLEPMGYTSNPPVGSAQREEWESLDALVRVARDHETLAGLLADLDERAADDDAPVAEAVTLASLHSAKGLEWDAVFMPGLYEGGLPLRYQGEMVDVAEERRLFYVGVTRARDVLELSYAKGSSRQRSRFLPRGGKSEPAPKVVTRKAGAGKPSVCANCGRRLSNGFERSLGTCSKCPSDVDADLIADLRAWRKGVVAERSAERGKSIPAFLVATDAVLIGIARAQPTSAAQLGRVKGIQKALVAERADELLQIVREHAH